MKSRILNLSFPDLSRIVLILSILSSVFMLSIFKTYEPDSWWHLKTGELILKTGSIPHSDPFTYTVYGQPWTSHQWLSEVILYLTFTLYGTTSLILFKAVLVTTTFWISLRTLLYRRINLPLSAGIVFLGAYLSRPMFVERPYILTFLLLSLTLFMLEKYRIEKSRLIFLLPPLFLLWANLHAGFIFGLFLMGIYLTGGLIDRILKRASESVDIGRFFIIIFLSVAASLFNPHTYKAFIHPFFIVKLYSEGGLTASEMLPTTFEGFPMLYFFMALLIISVIFSIRKAYAIDVLIAMAFTYLTLKARRNIEPYVLMAGPVLGRHLNISSQSIFKGINVSKIIDRFKERSTVFINIITVLIIFFLTVTIIRSDGLLKFGFGINGERYPVKAADFIERYGIKGNMYNEPDWGGYLTWRMYPERRVFVDSRGDVCKDVLFELQGFGKSTDWNRVVNKYHIDYAITAYSKGIPGGRTLPSADWALVYWDDVSMVYLKKIPGFKELIERFEYQYARPDLDISYLNRYLDGPDFQRAFSEFERKIKEDPESYKAHFSIGYLLTGLGFYKDAIREFRKVVDINKRIAAAHLMLGNLYESEGDRDKAIEEWRKVIKLSGRDKNIRMIAKENIRRLSERR